MASKAKYAVGIGAGLVGGVYLIHQARLWWVRRRLDQLRAKAARGEIPTRDFLNAALESGQPIPGAGGVKVTVAEATRMQCTAIFPAGLATLPEFAEALAELRRNGTCL